MKNELSRSFDNNDVLLEINNILDFSFGNDKNVEKSEDVNMVDIKPNNIKIEEEEEKQIFKNKKNYTKVVKNPLSPNKYFILKDSTFSESTQILICRKRKRKIELIGNEKKKIKKNKFFKKSFPYGNSFLRNKSENIYGIYEKMMNIKEDSIDNNRNNDEDNNDEMNNISNSKGYNFNNDYNFVLHKLKKINLNKID